MAAPQTPTITPTLECSCGHAIPLGSERVGDSVTCPGCSSYQVVIRSRTRGDVPAAVRAGGLSAEDRTEVDETLRRIKLRRVGQATRHVQLYPSWAIFVAGVQFYMSALLAGQNLISQGEPKRGKRLQVFGVVSYVVLGGGLLALGFAIPDVPSSVMAAVAVALPLGMASYFTWIQHASCAAARDAGAQNAPVLLPLLFGFILAIAQAFAVWFLALQVDGAF